MTVDAHLHVWDLTRGVYSWPDATVPSLHRTLTVEDIDPTLDALGIDGVILVQAADTRADTENMLAQAAHPRVRGVVAWADLAAEPEPFAADLAELRAHPAVVGIRNLTHVKGVDGWIRGARQQENIAQIARAKLPLDVVTARHDELRDVVYTLDSTPGIQVVVDHLGKPPIGGSRRDHQQWRAILADIAAHPASTAKLSGLYASVGAMDAWTPAQVTPFIDDALSLFGPHRLMYGGDWPVVLLAGGYERSWTATMNALGSLSRTDRAHILDGTATRVYGLQRPAR